MALLTALVLQYGFTMYHVNLYGFNAVLCAIAIGGLFFVLTWKSAIYALLAAAFSVVAACRHRGAARPDRDARPHRPVRAHHLAVPLAQGQLPGTLEPVALAADVTTPEKIRAGHLSQGSGVGLSSSTTPAGRTTTPWTGSLSWLPYR